MKETRAATLRDKVHGALAPVVLGQADLIDRTLIALIARGHVLLEGLPGMAKTLLVRSLARVFAVDFGRVQFTPDLMPADLLGYEMLDDRKGMRFVPGPIFTQFLLADEINRTPPKTQSALLEAMQESAVTIGGIRHALPDPFLVLATQNPLEQEGTYPLPEAQLDRFLFLLKVPYPSFDDEVKIAGLSGHPGADGTRELKAICTAGDLVKFQTEAEKTAVAPEVLAWMVRLVTATRPESEHAPKSVRDQVRVGASPRASRLLVQAAKAAAWLDGKRAVEKSHVMQVLAPVLRHRLLLRYGAGADGLEADALIDEIGKIRI